MTCSPASRAARSCSWRATSATRSHVRKIDRTELLLADEVFFCGTGVQIAEVVSIDDRPVGDGSSYPVVKRSRRPTSCGAWPRPEVRRLADPVRRRPTCLHRCRHICVSRSLADARVPSLTSTSHRHAGRPAVIVKIMRPSRACTLARSDRLPCRAARGWSLPASPARSRRTRCSRISERRGQAVPSPFAMRWSGRGATPACRAHRERRLRDRARGLRPAGRGTDVSIVGEVIVPVRLCLPRSAGPVASSRSSASTRTSRRWARPRGSCARGRGAAGRRRTRPAPER